MDNETLTKIQSGIRRAQKKIPLEERLDLAAQAEDDRALEKLIVLNQQDVQITTRARDTDAALSKAKRKYERLAAPYAQDLARAKGISDYAALLMQLPTAERQHIAAEARRAIEARGAGEDEDEDEDESERGRGRGRVPERKSEDESEDESEGVEDET